MASWSEKQGGPVVHHPKMISSVPSERLAGIWLVMRMPLCLKKSVLCLLGFSWFLTCQVCCMRTCSFFQIREQTSAHTRVPACRLTLWTWRPGPTAFKPVTNIQNHPNPFKSSRFPHACRHNVYCACVLLWKLAKTTVPSELSWQAPPKGGKRNTRIHKGNNAKRNGINDALIGKFPRNDTIWARDNLIPEQTTCWRARVAITQWNVEFRIKCTKSDQQVLIWSSWGIHFTGSFFSTQSQQNAVSLCLRKLSGQHQEILKFFR
jgi:hypothetical protein